LNKKIYRWAFVLFWFVLLPLGLTTLTISLLGADSVAFANAVTGQVSWFVREQKLPSIIIFFTLYEALIYGMRYSLPLAAQVGVAGRPGLPKESRKDFEHAGQLLDEVQQVLRKNKLEVDKGLSSQKRSEVDVAMQSLESAMAAPSFSIEVFEDAYDEAAAVASKHLNPWQRSEVREYTESIIIAVGVALLLRAFVVEAFKIPSGSMLPTLQINDHIFVNKFTYGPTIPFMKSRILSDLPPQRGDVIVFEFPDDNPANPRQNFIKRAMALPGDILETRGQHPVINGWMVPHCRVGTYEKKETHSGYGSKSELFVEFINDYAYLTMYENYDPDQGPELGEPYRVAPGEFWVMGDNRNNSSDSRRWHQGKGGGVPFDNVKGRAMFVWLSFDDDADRFLPVTWDRLFTNVMGAPRLPKEAPESLKKGIARCLTQRPENTTPPPPNQARLRARVE